MGQRSRTQVNRARRVGRVLAYSANRYYADRCPQQAAGIAYRVLFSIVPLAIVLVSLFGVLVGNQEVHDAVVDTIVRALPPTAVSRGEVADAITGIAESSGVIGLVTLAAFAWAATGMMTSIRMGLEVAVHATRPRTVARGKLIDLALVVGTALLVLATVAATLLDRMAQQGLRRIESAIGLDTALLADWLPRAAAAALSVAVVLLLYRFVPDRGLRRTDALAGAITTSLLLLAISLASSLVYDSVTRLSAVYGSLTAAFVFLYSVYLYASALLFGGEVAAAWSAPVDSVTEPARELRDSLRRLLRRRGREDV